MKTFLATLLFAYTYAEETSVDDAMSELDDALSEVADAMNDLVRTGVKTEFTIHKDQWTGSYFTSCVNATNLCSVTCTENYVLGGYAASGWTYMSSHWGVMKMGDVTTNLAASVVSSTADSAKVTWTGWKELKDTADFDAFKADATGPTYYALNEAVIGANSMMVPTGTQKDGNLTLLNSMELLPETAAEDAKGLKVGDEWTLTVNSWEGWTGGDNPQEAKLTTSEAVAFKILQGATTLAAGAAVVVASLAF